MGRCPPSVMGIWLAASHKACTGSAQGTSKGKLTNRQIHRSPNQSYQCPARPPYRRSDKVKVGRRRPVDLVTSGARPCAVDYACFGRFFLISITLALGTCLSPFEIATASIYYACNAYTLGHVAVLVERLDR